MITSVMRLRKTEIYVLPFLVSNLWGTFTKERKNMLRKKHTITKINTLIDGTINGYENIYLTIY